MVPARPDDTFHARLEAALLARGVTRDAWARFVRWLRSPRHGIEPIGGRPIAVGRFILRAWRRERRVPEARVAALAGAVEAALPGGDDGLEQLACWRGREATPWQPASNVPRRLATCRTTLDILRHHLDSDPGGSAPRREALESVRHRYQHTDEDDQRREMALWARPLGKRTAPPAACGPLPHPERFDVVWAFPWRAPYSERGPDELRDVLGLVSLTRGMELVVFHYTAAQTGEVAEPTAVEVLGGWAYLPAPPGTPQMTYDYRKLQRGAPEFVHAARVPPASCRFTWLGALTRDWRG